MQFCDQTCGQCARHWFKWLKAREHQMSQPHKRHGVQYNATFAEAAATSNRPPREGENEV